MREVVAASRMLLWQKNYFLFFLLGVPILFFLFVLIPTKTIPGNSLVFLLTIFTLKDYLLFTLLAVLASLLLAMNIYVFWQKRALIEVGKGGLGGASSVVGVVFGTATCASCIAALFGFLGLPAVLFLIKARFYIVTGAILIILASVYFASKKIVQVCKECGYGKI